MSDVENLDENDLSCVTSLSNVVFLETVSPGRTERSRLDRTTASFCVYFCSDSVKKCLE